MSLQMALIADLGAFCLFPLALVTKRTWDMNSSVDVSPLHDSLMYKGNRNSPASGKRTEQEASLIHTTYDSWISAVFSLSYLTFTPVSPSFCRCGTFSSYSYRSYSIIIVFLMSTSYEVIDECGDWLLPHLAWSCLESGPQAETTAWCRTGSLPRASSRRIIMLVKSWKVSTLVDTLPWQWASKVWWWRRRRSAFKPGSSNMTSTISLCFITALSAQHKNSFVLFSLYESSTKHLRDHFVSRCAVSLANSLGSTLSLGWASWGSERGNTGSQWTKILLRQDLHSVRWLSSCFSMSASSARFSFRERPLEKETLPRALSFPIPEREDEQKTMFIAFKIQGIV